MSEEKSQNDAKPAISMRPMEPEDEPFLYEVYSSTRAFEMSLVPWDDAMKETFLRQQFTAQRDYYLKHYPNAQYLVLLLDNRPIGRLYVDRRPDEIRIMDITLLPEHRSRGLGTPLIKDLMSEGERDRKSVSIYVESYSPALNLFRRLGFAQIEDNGVNVLLRWNPAA